MSRKLTTVGWCEWISLPNLGLPWIKAKIDTGHRISILHTFYYETFEKENTKMLRFGIHPFQNSIGHARLCEAPIFEEYEALDSNDNKEIQYVIETTLDIGNEQWPIKLLITNQQNIDKTHDNNNRFIYVIILLFLKNVVRRCLNH